MFKVTETVEQAAKKFVGICRLERRVHLPKETVIDIDMELTVPSDSVELSLEEQEILYAEKWESLMKCELSSSAGMTYLQNKYD